jgi:hypothetical protein
MSSQHRPGIPADRTAALRRVSYPVERPQRAQTSQSRDCRADGPLTPKRRLLVASPRSPEGSWRIGGSKPSPPPLRPGHSSFRRRLRNEITFATRPPTGDKLIVGLG